jgi:hypothetical protein
MKAGDRAYDSGCCSRGDGSPDDAALGEFDGAHEFARRLRVHAEVTGGSSAREPREGDDALGLTTQAPHIYTVVR